MRSQVATPPYRRGSLVASVSRLSRHPQAVSIGVLWLLGLIMVSNGLDDTTHHRNTVPSMPPASCHPDQAPVLPIPLPRLTSRPLDASQAP